jgi:3-oxoacyl-[acyl-carrier protein] reductase
MTLFLFGAGRMQLDLTGRNAIVTGGSRGIGRSIALTFAEAGANVSICARGESTLRETEAELRRFGHTVHAMTCDLVDAEAVRNYVTAAAQALGGIDVLVNNASGFGSGDDEAGWAASINVDLLSSVRASRAALPYLEKSQGAIIHLSSTSALKQSARTPAYGAVKAALVQYTLSQAAQLAPKRIRVNCIAPGSIEFPGGLWARRKTVDPKLYQSIIDRIPFGRLGNPQEVANVALFLASNAASWVTGQTIAVDGGQLLG